MARLMLLGDCQKTAITSMVESISCMSTNRSTAFITANLQRVLATTIAAGIIAAALSRSGGLPSFSFTTIGRFAQIKLVLLSVIRPSTSEKRKNTTANMTTSCARVATNGKQPWLRCRVLTERQDSVKSSAASAAKCNYCAAGYRQTMQHLPRHRQDRKSGEAARSAYSKAAIECESQYLHLRYHRHQPGHRMDTYTSAKVLYLKLDSRNFGLVSVRDAISQ